MPVAPAPRLLPAPLVLALALALGAGAARAEPRTYALDPVHTRVVFAVDHAGFSRAIGTVSGSTGTLVFDPEDWSTARLRAEIPVAAIDLGDARWNRAALGRNLLDAEGHPVAVFASERVEPLAEDRAAVHGTLTLRGVSRPLSLTVRLNALKRHPLPPFRSTAGFTAVGTLDRTDYGIDAWGSMIGRTVELHIEAEATRTRAAAAEAIGNGDRKATPPPAAEGPQASLRDRTQRPPEHRT
ncbi:YceI family protein [Luteimonas sp. RD2P54]|uniref:YceI family protein n=1 Tax=Luteimonas endophytica TaxID=3042023 RepID=A0ABT6J9M3_9GAMM|nr:YceI family protein [Luteimonas endophytica]MDH5823521.1 YceI family protein [Luteimonas endophytica]